MSIKSDPYVINLSYGQIAHLRYSLGRVANVTVTVRDPAMATVATLVSNESQAAGDQEVVWDGTTFTGQLPATPGHYTFSVTATDPVTGASVTRRGNVTVFK